MSDYKTDYEPATGRIDCLPIPTDRNQGWPGVYAVLYTDCINDRQTSRDDLWIATTGAIKAAIERAQHDAYAEGRKASRSSFRHLTSDQQYWLDRRAQIIEALAAYGLQIVSTKDRAWIAPY